MQLDNEQGSAAERGKARSRSLPAMPGPARPPTPGSRAAAASALEKAKSIKAKKAAEKAAAAEAEQQRELLEQHAHKEATQRVVENQQRVVLEQQRDTGAPLDALLKASTMMLGVDGASIITSAYEETSTSDEHGLQVLPHVNIRWLITIGHNRK